MAMAHKDNLRNPTDERRHHPSGWFSSDNDDEEQDDDDDNSSVEDEHQKHPSGESKSKMSQSAQDQDIADLYAQQQGAALKKKRVPRPKVQLEQLTGSQGLLQLIAEFSCTMGKGPTGPPTTVPSAANYVKRLLQGYQQWAVDLIPVNGPGSSSLQNQQHPMDILATVARLGSHKNTKAFLQLQRHEWCRNRFLERVLGKDDAERLLQEYEDYQTQQQQEEDDFVLSTQEYQSEANTNAIPNNELSSTPAAIQTVKDNLQNSSTSISNNNNTTRSLPELEHDVSVAVVTEGTKNMYSSQKRKRIILEDDDENDQLIEFDDDSTDDGTSHRTTTVTTKTNISAKKQHLNDKSTDSEPKGMDATTEVDSENQDGDEEIEEKDEEQVKPNEKVMDEAATKDLDNCVNIEDKCDDKIQSVGHHHSMAKESMGEYQVEANTFQTSDETTLEQMNTSIDDVWKENESPITKNPYLGQPSPEKTDFSQDESTILASQMSSNPFLTSASTLTTIDEDTLDE